VAQLNLTNLQGFYRFLGCATSAPKPFIYLRTRLIIREYVDIK